MYTTPYAFGAREIAFEKELLPNEFLIMRNGSKSALCVYDAKADQIKRIENRSCYGIRPRNAEQSFALNALLDKDIPLVTLSGKAGTGKTLLALAASLALRVIDPRCCGLNSWGRLPMWRSTPSSLIFRRWDISRASMPSSRILLISFLS